MLGRSRPRSPGPHVSRVGGRDLRSDVSRSLRLPWVEALPPGTVSTPRLRPSREACQRAARRDVARLRGDDLLRLRVVHQRHRVARSRAQGRSTGRGHGPGRGRHGAARKHRDPRGRRVRQPHARRRHRGRCCDGRPTGRGHHRLRGDRGHALVEAPPPASGRRTRGRDTERHRHRASHRCGRAGP
jgi:hypothetical protein